MRSDEIRIDSTQLLDAIRKIGDEYQRDVSAAVDDALQEAGKSGRSIVRRKASAYGWSSQYVNGWQYKVSKGRTGTTVVVFNGSRPGLPHLLEFSHPIRHPYGNVHAKPTISKAKPHVKPAEDELINEVIEQIRRSLG